MLLKQQTADQQNTHPPTHTSNRLLCLRVSQLLRLQQCLLSLPARFKDLLAAIAAAVDVAVAAHRSLYKWVPQSDDEDSDEDLDASEGTHRGRGLGGAAAAAAAAMAAAAAAGVARRAAAGVSDHFVCFDADPQVGC